jgi:hypothetical protein
MVIEIKKPETPLVHREYYYVPSSLLSNIILIWENKQKSILVYIKTN